MKKVVFLIFIVLLSIPSFSQMKTTYDMGGVTSIDTLHWTRIEGVSPVTVYWDFTDLNADDAKAWVYYGDEDEENPGTINPISVEKSSTINRRYPITLNKLDSVYYNVINANADTNNVFGVRKKSWEYDYIGFKVLLNSVTDGDLIQYIER